MADSIVGVKEPAAALVTKNIENEQYVDASARTVQRQVVAVHMATTADPLAVHGDGFVRSTLNSTSSTLTAGSTWTGTWEPISDYPQLGFTISGRPSVFQGDANTAWGTVWFDFSPDGGTTTTVAVPSLVDPGYHIPVELVPVGTHFRIRYLNDGGAAIGFTFTARNLTAFRVDTYLRWQPTKELARTLNQTIRADQPATLVRSMQIGSPPDGLTDASVPFGNVPIPGTKTLSPATSLLGASGVYTSDWFDMETYPTLRLLVASDQVSADNGIEIQWSDTSTGVAVRSRLNRTFRSGHISTGRLITTATRARYMRVKYTNGSTIQTVFHLGLRWGSMPVAQEMELVPLSAGATGQQDVTLIATQIATVALAGRKAMRVKCMSTSARPMFFGFSSGVLATTGDEIAVGESVDLDIDEFVTIYVVTTSTAGAGVRCSWTELS